MAVEQLPFGVAITIAATDTRMLFANMADSSALMARRILLWWNRAIFLRGVCRGPSEAVAQRQQGQVLSVGIALIPSPDFLVAFDCPTRRLQVPEYPLCMCPLGWITDAVEIEPHFADPDAACTLHSQNAAANVRL